MKDSSYTEFLYSQGCDQFSFILLSCLLSGYIVCDFAFACPFICPSGSLKGADNKKKLVPFKAQSRLPASPNADVGPVCSFTAVGKNMNKHKAGQKSSVLL